MLPRDRRLTSSDRFGVVVRRGRRAGGPLVVVHAQSSVQSSAQRDAERGRAGLIVSKAVGNAVHRNQVKRRLRALLADRPTPGYDIVVRAQPDAATATASELSVELDRCLQRCLADRPDSEPSRGSGPR